MAGLRGEPPGRGAGLAVEHRLDAEVGRMI